VARIRQEDVEAVKERTDIVQLVGQYLTLKKSGHDSLTGLCPFHQEKTGSFSVSPAKQVFYCFGCGKGGDAITFLRELEHLSYVEAIERLASTAGVTLRYEGDSAAERRAAERRRSLYRANEQAASMFSTMLTSGKEATDARAYVTERGISAESIETFEIGYAPGLLRLPAAAALGRARPLGRDLARGWPREPRRGRHRARPVPGPAHVPRSKTCRAVTSASAPASCRPTRAPASRRSTSTPPRRRSTASTRCSTTCTARDRPSPRPATCSWSRATPT
jgi:DNA primase